MKAQPLVLFENESHRCLCFDSLAKGEGTQVNQFLIIDNDQRMILDPGGGLTHIPLSWELSKIFPLQDLDYVFASHHDPGIIAAIDKWLLYTNAKVVCSKLWLRFLPYLTTGYLSTSKGLSTYERVISVDDRGGLMQLGRCQLKILPAHFMHSAGNLQIYDPISKILFSGDIGVSLVKDASPVQDFAAHEQYMRGFHRRYIASNRVTRLWVAMVRKLDVDMIIPQHGRPFVGKAMIEAFLNWVEKQQCGIDLLGSDDFQVPQHGLK